MVIIIYQIIKVCTKRSLKYLIESFYGWLNWINEIYLNYFYFLNVKFIKKIKYCTKENFLWNKIFTILVFYLDLRSFSSCLAYFSSTIV